VQGLTRFPEPWTITESKDGVRVHDATGRYLMGINHRQDLHDAGWTQSDNYLTAEEAKVLAGWIVRLPGLMQRPPY
jgi:hypothetical protein